MTDLLDDMSLDIPCPRCGQKTSKTIGWLKTHDHLRCPACGADIAIEAEELRAQTARVEAAIADLGKDLDKL